MILNALVSLIAILAFALLTLPVFLKKEDRRLSDYVVVSLIGIVIWGILIVGQYMGYITLKIM